MWNLLAEGRGILLALRIRDDQGRRLPVRQRVRITRVGGVHHKRHRPPLGLRRDDDASDAVLPAPSATGRYPDRTHPPPIALRLPRSCRWMMLMHLWEPIHSTPNHPRRRHHSYPPRPNDSSPLRTSHMTTLSKPMPHRISISVTVCQGNDSELFGIRHEVSDGGADKCSPERQFIGSRILLAH